MRLRSKGLALLVGSLALLGGIVSLAYAATLSLSINTAVTGTYRNSNDLGGTLFSIDPTLQAPIKLASGTGSGQANLIFSDSRTIAASSSENLDVAGSLVDPLGSTLTFATIKAIRICAADGNTNNVVVGGAGSNTLAGIFADASDKILVKPGGCFVWVAPKTGAAVSASDGDILLVANSSSGTSVTYSVIIVGTSA
jgi:hypothetical protein